MGELFSEYQIRDVTFKNRIVMSPMCMYSCFNQDGKVTDWHRLHYSSRAVGQVGLIILESTAVSPSGRISLEDLGIWDNSQIEGLKNLVGTLHSHGSKVGIQLSHAGRKSRTGSSIFAPASIPFTDERPVPIELDISKIKEIINDFKLAAKRADEAGFDVIELHGAHGYLIHQFISPISNKRTDQYGGNLDNRLRFLKEIISAIREVWLKPLFVRVSANEYDPEGNDIEDYIYIAKEVKKCGVDLIDCSSGGVNPKKVKSYPGYQIQYAEKIKFEANIRTGAVGLISNAMDAELILQNEVADLIFIGRELLRQPNWPIIVAKELREELSVPKQYKRAWNF
ncbi:NADPH dehydrogenase NamA [Alkalihalobacillus sp. BA299]|uniref:NADPH dehydrogenase NamA n=1 Tax=Alkalihalobacillus sp. BA299 TaxID=2815938 RepID=UPI001ADD5155|nr:NADPH dehydrogenase NamA [Alkalihalobacillus sp. BA299]